jgi:hypothetical protein
MTIPQAESREPVILVDAIAELLADNAGLREELARRDAERATALRWLGRGWMLGYRERRKRARQAP